MFGVVSRTGEVLSMIHNVCHGCMCHIDCEAAWLLVATLCKRWWQNHDFFIKNYNNYKTADSAICALQEVVAKAQQKIVVIIKS